MHRPLSRPHLPLSSACSAKGTPTLLPRVAACQHRQVCRSRGAGPRDIGTGHMCSGSGARPFNKSQSSLRSRHCTEWARPDDGARSLAHGHTCHTAACAAPGAPRHTKHRNGTPAVLYDTVAQPGAGMKSPQLLLRNGTPAVLHSAVAKPGAEGKAELCFTVAQVLGRG